jgi:hypothetical protein
MNMADLIFALPLVGTMAAEKYLDVETNTNRILSEVLISDTIVPS